jgi:hypothetical protein
MRETLLAFDSWFYSGWRDILADPVLLRRARFASISSGLQPRVAPLLTLLRFWWMADGRSCSSVWEVYRLDRDVTSEQLRVFMLQEQ